jgi:hypothetical protein
MLASKLPTWAQKAPTSRSTPGRDSGSSLQQRTWGRLATRTTPASAAT